MAPLRPTSAELWDISEPMATRIPLPPVAGPAFGPYCPPALCLVFVQVEHLWAEITEQTA